jgi:hypothetical protein
MMRPLDDMDYTMLMVIGAVLVITIPELARDLYRIWKGQR